MDNSDEEEEPPECVGKAKATFQPITKASADFKFGEIPLLGQTLGQYDTPESASANLNKVVDSYIACKEFTFLAGTNVYTGTLNELSFTQVGDETRALASNIDVDGITVGVNVIYFRVGNTVAIVLYLDLGAPLVDDVQKLVNLAHRKLSST